ncbi:tetratricopeptide repeat protein [Actinosynnema sp. NPDC023587]|uniref:helix-turn-helix domain-containing protein n=1 Tax=Actinosynnema sp. NPDC023587 TaxID=3154695 RepID=UPI0033F55D32
MEGIKNSSAVEAGFADQLRRARGPESQSSVARRMKYSASHYSNVENGLKPPTEDFARACDTAFATGSQFVALVGHAQARSGSGTRARPAELPHSPRLVGRTALLDALDKVLTTPNDGHSPRVIALDGQAGVGKTTVALAWAHHAKAAYPDGALFVDLRGYAADGDPANPDHVLEHMLKVLGVPSTDVPVGVDWKAALLRTVLSGTRTLLLLDNAADIEQVRSFIPAEPGCLVIVTSRRRLSGLAVRHGAHTLTVEKFDESEAVALLRDVVGAERVDLDLDAAHRIIRSCGGLPLAVRVAAERVAASRHLTLAGLADELSGESRRLDVLTLHDIGTAVRAVFSWSFRALEPAAARTFRLLSLHPDRDFGVGAASALTGYPMPETTRLLDTLTGVHLLHEVGHRRYRFHDLIRDYAVERVSAEETIDDTVGAVRTLASWYLRTMAAANEAMSPNRPQAAIPDTTEPAEPLVFATVHDAVRWVEAELANLAAMTRQAATLGIHDLAFGFPVVLGYYLYWRRPWHLWVGPMETGLAEARRLGDTAAQASLLNNLATAYLDLHRVRDAHDSFAEAMRLRVHDGDRLGQVWSGIGIGRALQSEGDHIGAHEHYLTVQALCAELGDRWGWAMATAYVGDARRALGDHDAALEALQQSHAVMRRLDDPQSQSCALGKISDVHRDRGDQAARLAYLQQALAASSGAADLWGQAELRRKLGRLHLEHHRPDQARQAWTEALQLFEALGDTRAVGLRADLAELDAGDLPTPRCPD